MSRYSVTISELPETAGKSATILQMNPVFGIHMRNSDDFAVRTAESLRPEICIQDKLVAG
jgi:hypothetical protein